MKKHVSSTAGKCKIVDSQSRVTKINTNLNDGEIMNETETAIHGRWSLKIDSRKRYTLIKNWFKKAIYFNQNGITILLPVEIIEGSLWSWKDFIRWLQTRVSTVGQCYRRTSWNVSNQQWWWYIIPRRKPDSYHISILHSRELSTTRLLHQT